MKVVVSGNGVALGIVRIQTLRAASRPCDHFTISDCVSDRYHYDFSMIVPSPCQMSVVSAPPSPCSVRRKPSPF